MKVGIEAVLSDKHVDSNKINSQRQLEVSIVAISPEEENSLPLNLCLILDRSGSMKGTPMEKVKQAAMEIVEKLNPEDRLSVISFNHNAEVIVSNQSIAELQQIQKTIKQLKADGGTAIDEGLKLGMKEIAEGKKKSSFSDFIADRWRK